MKALVRLSNGDMRKALNILQVIIMLTSSNLFYLSLEHSFTLKSMPKWKYNVHLWAIMPILSGLLI